ncbi:PAS domain-containing protein [Panacibacter sp. DH6]|uniref:histidine kinase n=1 Tax=Panacibacter microcysteis TaxID=2793269 RepID=A0A931GZA1_9BACT|nr:ATP-binding protein [Panacibacter microcysteis]MBG9378109.1 PAS domain-containing protein [Panacibacter microcysteis]
MQTGSSSFYSAQEMQQFMQNSMFRALLDAMPIAVQVLRAVRDDSGSITDFLFVFSNTTADALQGKKLTGKQLHTHPGNAEADRLFIKFLEAAGQQQPLSFAYAHSTAAGVQWLDYTAQKFGDGVLVSYTAAVQRQAGQLPGENGVCSPVTQPFAGSRATPEAINENEHLLFAALESTLNHIQVFNAIRREDGNITDFQPVLSNKNTGQANGDTKGRKVSQTNPGIFTEGIFSKWVQVAETGNSIQFEQYYDHEGYSGWFEQAVVKMGDGVVVSTKDITERKLAEIALKESQYLLKSVFDTNLVGMAVHEAVFDAAGNITDFRIKIANRQLEQLTGRTNLEGKLYSEEYPGIKQTPVFEAMKRVVETGKPQELEYHYRHDGFDKHFLSMFIKFDGGLVATNLDITERKMNENQIKEQAAYISRITETVPDMISIVELSTRKYEFINTRTFTSEGFNTDELSAKPREELSQMIHPEDLHGLQAFFAKFYTMSDDEITHADYRARNNETESWRWFKVRGRVFKRNSEGVATHGLNVIQNITYQKEAEEKIAVLNKKLLHKNRELEAANAGIKTFTSIAANDYKETLKHLYTNLEFIISNEAKKLSDAGKANLRRAQSGIQKMKLLTDDIVNYLKIPSLDNVLADIDMNEILKTVINDLQDKIHSAGTVIEADPLPSLKGFPLLISLLFYHLLDNAIKFRKEDQPGLVHIGYKKLNNIHIDDAIPNMVYHRITVTDNGTGFNPVDGEKLFEIFYKPPQKKYRGSGIGLSICKRIMDIHHGFIQAESNEGNGAVFLCYFPAELPFSA